MRLTKNIILLVILLTPCLGFAVSNNDELLPAEQAFKFSAKMLSDNRIRTIWEIADGYYMYRDKMDFEFIGGGIITSVPEFPTGNIKQDSLFGEVAVFTKNLIVDVSTNGATNYTLIAKGQGCNEPVGICYPPITQKVVFGDKNYQAPFSDSLNLENKLPQSKVLDSTTLASANDLRSLLAAGFEQKAFLDVDEAFKLSIDVIGEHELNAVFDIADGYYLYREKTSFSVDQNQNVLSVSLPDGEIKEDEYFGEVAVFDSDFSVPITFEERIEDLKGMVFQANYQGCALDGICYSPVFKSFDFSDLSLITTADANYETALSFNTNIADDKTNSNGGMMTGQSAETLVQIGPDDVSNSEDEITTTTTQDDTTTSQNPIIENPLLPLLVGAFIAGILLTFTPCVLPMIPVLSSVIAGQGTKLTKTKGGILAGVYVLGTMVTYAGMGALAGATGDQLQAYFQNIWAIGLLSGLFFIMGLSMFGLFEIQMPGFIQSKVQAKTNNMSGSISLVFILGLFSALIIGACVSPVLISFLGIAVSKGNPVLGAQLMTMMAAGMGLPLILLGFGAGHFIPKAGVWMDKIKQGFGVMLIGVAIYLLGLLPQVPILLLWGGFFIILSIFLGSTIKAPKIISNWQRLEKGIGIILMVWGIFLIAGGLLGQRDILRPLPQKIISIITGDAGIQQNNTIHKFIRVSNPEQLDMQLALAHSQQKLVLIDYYADWCVDCVRMEKTTFADPAVTAVLKERYISLQIDVTDPNDVDIKLLKQRFNVFGPPATLFFDRNGNPLAEKFFYGYLGSEKFLELISEI